MDSYVGKEIFIITGDISDCNVVDLVIAEDWQALIQQLSQMKPDVSSDSVVLHGVLASAEYMPTTFRNKTPFVIYVDPEDSTSGVILESDSNSPTALSGEIAFALDNQEFAVDMPFTIQTESTFILYGYELSTCLSVDIDEIDEEAIETCKQIVNEIKREADTVSTKMKVEIYLENDKANYEGRCLGFVTPEEFAALVTATDLRKKLFTVATTSLADIAALDNVNGLRLALAVTKQNGNNLIGKKLLITDAFEYVSTFKKDAEFLSVNCKNSYMILEQGGTE